MAGYFVSLSSTKLARNKYEYLKAKLQTEANKYDNFVIYDMGQKTILEVR